VEDTLSTSAAYVWEDGDGTKHYFEDPDKDGVYKDEDGLELTLTISGGQYTITDKNGNTSIFDSYNRLVKMRNNQQTKSEIVITYEGTTKKITEIRDGAGRKYSFIYSNDLLSQIAYKGTGSSTIAYVNFSYTNSQLTAVTDQDGKVSAYEYKPVPENTTDSSHVPVLKTVTDVDGYNIQYTYTSTLPYRVIGIAEKDGTAVGSSMTIEYGHNQTIFTDANNNTQISQYNDWGNLISVQDNEGHAQFAQYALNKHDEDTGKGNQLKFSSKMQNTVVNLLYNSNFESGNSWTLVSSNASFALSTAQAYLGSQSLSVTSKVSGTAICAAPVGVGALASATKSDIVKSTSCPTALITGILQAYISRATISSLNGHKSSILPPPLPTINVLIS
jgi:YD repeat-containing protein